MMVIEHVLEGLNCTSVKCCIGWMVHSKIQGFLWIMDIELRIKRRFSRSRDKGTNLMINTQVGTLHCAIPYD